MIVVNGKFFTIRFMFANRTATILLREFCIVPLWRDAITMLEECLATHFLPLFRSEFRLPSTKPTLLSSLVMRIISFAAAIFELFGRESSIFTFPSCFLAFLAVRRCFSVKTIGSEFLFTIWASFHFILRVRV